MAANAPRIVNAVALQRNTHFLGAKIKSLRKRNGQTLEELSARCIQLDAGAAPSVSYLSMIESGRRVPSQRVLELLGRVFQRDIAWFLDDNLEPTLRPESPAGATTPAPSGIPLEPAFLFSRPLLQTALPELLTQTGTTGRQFAQLLIRSYQEAQRNRFPDLERAAEDVGGRRFPLSVDELLQLYRHHDIKIRWFERPPVAVKSEDGTPVKQMLRSFFVRPGIVYINRLLERDAARLKYDLAGHLGHRVLHSGDGLRSSYSTGHQADMAQTSGSGGSNMEAADILHAWRDFECSFFAGALLGPKQPFRRFLAREAYDPLSGDKVGITPALVMRRMTSVSPYQHWHYFDAYPPGRLRAVYRGNGIPLPWGNMTMVSDPCPQWAVFRMLHEKPGRKPSAQISLLQDRDRYLLYCCLSLRTNDAARNPHVISVGLDLAPAMDSRRLDARSIIDEIATAVHRQRGTAELPARARDAIRDVARELNIAWIETGLQSPPRLICPRSNACPRHDCEAYRPRTRRPETLDTMRDEILREITR